MRVYSPDEVHAALPWEPLADALAAAFVGGGTQVPLRHVHDLAGQDRLLLMPAWNPCLVLLKLVTVLPVAPTKVQATVLVADRATGKPLAVLDGEALTLRRTAATSALAARHLARTDSHTLLVVGCGRLAGWMARAHVALRPQLRRVWVWGRRPEAATALAHELGREGLPSEAVPDLEVATRGACIVCCATTSTEPLVHGAWITPGTHLDLVGSFTPRMREVDDDAVVRARIVVDTYAGAWAEAGDLVQPLARGLIEHSHIAADLATVLRGQRIRQTELESVTLFKSVGTALEDMAAAQMALGLNT